MTDVINLEVKRLVSKIKRKNQEELHEAEEVRAKLKQHVLDLISQGKHEEAAMFALRWAEDTDRAFAETLWNSKDTWINSISNMGCKDLQLEILREHAS